MIYSVINYTAKCNNQNNLSSHTVLNIYLYPRCRTSHGIQSKNCLSWQFIGQPIIFIINSYMRRSTFPGLFVSDEKRGGGGSVTQWWPGFQASGTPPATSSPTYGHLVRRQQTQLLLSNYVPSIPAASSFATPANFLLHSRPRRRRVVAVVASPIGTR